MIRLAWTPAKSDADAAGQPTGYVTAAPGGSLTDGRQGLGTCTLAQAVHAAVVAKLAYAIYSSPCIPKWLLSGTMPETQAHQVTTQPNQIKRCGG